MASYMVIAMQSLLFARTSIVIVWGVSSSVAEVVCITGTEHDWAWPCSNTQHPCIIMSMLVAVILPTNALPALGRAQRDFVSPVRWNKDLYKGVARSACLSLSWPVTASIITMEQNVKQRIVLARQCNPITPSCPLVGRTNSIISNVPQEWQWALKG